MGKNSWDILTDKNILPVKNILTSWKVLTRQTFLPVETVKKFNCLNGENISTGNKVK